MEDVKAVVSAMHLRTFAAGTRICAEGDENCEEFFIIVGGEGKVRVHQRASAPGEDIELGVLSRFDSFGVAALASPSSDASGTADGSNSGSVRAASCTSIEGTVETLVLYRSVFHEMLGEIEAKGNSGPDIQRQRRSVCDILSVAATSEMASFKALAMRGEVKSSDNEDLEC